MKEGHATNDGIGKIHDQVDRALWRYIDRIHPFRSPYSLSILLIYKKVNLMNMKWMNLVGLVRHPPVDELPDLHGRHRRICWSVFFIVDVEAVLILGKLHDKLRLFVLKCPD